MALKEIITKVGEPMIYDMARGNLGVLSDIQSEKYNHLELSAAIGGGGGNIFIMSE